MSSLARATALMSVGTIISRATGLLRLAAIAAALGVAESRLADTYNLANTAPNIIYELILGGILTSVFVPVFVDLLEKEGREKAWEVASAVINLSMVVLTVMTIIGVLGAPWIARLYTIGLEASDAEAQRAVLTFLLRLFIPQIIFYGLAAITAGLLNAHKKFAAPMFTPILNNLFVISVFILFHQAYPELGSLETISNLQLSIIGLGTTAGIVLMALAQLPFLRGLGGYRLTFSVSHPAIKQLAKLSTFVIGYVITNQIGYIIIQILANQEQGGYSAYVNAFTFFLLPHGLFAVSIITALLPSMSAHASNGRWDDFRERLSTGIRTTALLIFPAAVGYFVLGESIIRFLLERGVMTAVSTELVAGVLRFFVLGLLPFAIFQLFLRAFYAMQDSRTPFWINVVAVAVNTAINIPMFLWLGVRGLAAGHALAYCLGVVLQGRALSRRIGGLDGRRVARSFGRILSASLLMGALVWGTSEVMERLIEPIGLLRQTVTLGVPVGFGVVSYLAFAHLMRVEELSYARSLLTRRLGRKTESSG